MIAGSDDEDIEKIIEESYKEGFKEIFIIVLEKEKNVLYKENMPVMC